MTEITVQTIQQTKPHKFYAYRNQTVFVAALLAILSAGFLPDFLQFFSFTVYQTLSVLGDWIHYKLLKLKESDRVDPGRLFYDEGITPEQLDEYMDFMVKVRLYAYGVACFAFFVGWFFQHPFLSFVSGYFLVNTIGFLWARFSPHIHQPLEFKSYHTQNAYIQTENKNKSYAGLSGYNAAGDYIGSPPIGH